MNNTFSTKKVSSDNIYQNNEYLEAAMLAGCISLENGAETQRCEETMKYILKASGAKDCTASVMSTAVIASIGEKTKLASIDRWSTDLNKVCIVNDISRALNEGRTDITSAYMELLHINSAAPYSLFTRFAASVLVAALLPLFSSSNPLNCVAAIINGFILGLAGELFSHIRIRYFIVNILQSILMVLFTDLFALICHGNIDINIVLAAAITPMLPGIALTNGVRDLLAGDYLSGAGRMMEALVKALSIAIGVGAGLWLYKFFQLPVSEIYPAISPEWMIVIRIIASYIIALGYTIRMVNPKKAIWLSALVGAIGRLTFIFFMDYLGFSETASTFIATLLIAYIGNLMSKRYKTPTIVYLISGIMCMVPGTSLYKCVYFFVNNNLSASKEQLISTIFISGAIAVAIFLIGALFQVYGMAKRKTLFIK